MKITLRIQDSLYEEARMLATQERTTIKALIEDGLRLIIAEHKQPRVFKLRRASFKGNGLNPDLVEGSWEKTRQLAYEGREG
jgi:hypothetical protein